MVVSSVEASAAVASVEASMDVASVEAAVEVASVENSAEAFMEDMEDINHKGIFHGTVDESFHESFHGSNFH